MADAIHRPVEVYRASGLAEAYALRSVLEDEGIAVRIENESLDAIGMPPHDWSTLPRVTVDATNEAAARAILTAYLERRATPEPTDDNRCLACREPMGERTTCAACGWTFSTEPNDADEVSPRSPDAKVETPSPVPDPIPSASPQLRFEIVAVLAVGVFPSLISAICFLIQPTPSQLQWLDAMNMILLNGCTIVATLFIMRQSGTDWGPHGLTTFRPGDAAVAVPVFLVALLIWWVGSWLPRSGEFPHEMYAKSPSGILEWALQTLRLLLGAYSEELVTRVYLVTRLTDLLKSRVRAVVIAAVLFASYHIYQGPEGAVNSFCFGLAFGLIYCLHRRIWPLVLGHAGYNLFLDLITAAFRGD